MSGPHHSEMEPWRVCSGERILAAGGKPRAEGRWEGVRVTEPHEAAFGAATAFWREGTWCTCVFSTRKPDAC